MASHAPDFGKASALPLSVVLTSIPSYPRAVIESLIAKLIDHLDEEDAPEEDLELDEPDAPEEDLELSWPERYTEYALSFPEVYDPTGTEDDEDNGDREEVFSD